MEIKEILKRCDHTLLSQTATWDNIKEVLDDAIKFSTASACIPPSFVKRAKEYVGDKLKICTVIGFPNGYNTTKSKIYEAICAVEDGADEVDMVAPIGLIKQKDYDGVLQEIKKVKTAVKDKILKVIVETCLLTEEEKIEVCKTVSLSGADFIKTSTGFSTGGATKEDVILFKRYAQNGLKIKAAGGISSLEDAENFIKLGADRLGTSKIVKILKSQKDLGNY